MRPAPTARRALAALSAILLAGACGDGVSPEPPSSARPILFIGRTMSPNGNLGEPSVHSVRADGSGLQDLELRDAAQTLYPAWSRDGSTIAFGTGEQIASEVWLADADGGNVRPAATSLPECVYAYTRITWSPDGEQLAAECWGETWVAALAEDTVYSLTALVGEDVTHPDWSPDGTRILFHSGAPFPGDIVAVTPEGTDPTPLLSSAVDPVWSPDGQRIAFASEANGRRSIYIANADGTGIRRITDPSAEEGLDEAPAWSPDGRWLAFHRGIYICDDAEVCFPFWSVYVVRDDGAGLRRITPDGLLGTRPTW